MRFTKIVIDDVRKIEIKESKNKIARIEEHIKTLKNAADHLMSDFLNTELPRYLFMLKTMWCVQCSSQQLSLLV